MSKGGPHGLKVGQKLWLMPNRNLGSKPVGCEVAVTKVGRSFAHIEYYRDTRIFLDTLAIDGKGYSSPGACWLTKAHHDAHLVRCEKWKAIRLCVERAYSPPDGIDLDAVAAALGISELPA